MPGASAISSARATTIPGMTEAFRIGVEAWWVKLKPATSTLHVLGACSLQELIFLGTVKAVKFLALRLSKHTLRDKKMDQVMLNLKMSRYAQNTNFTLVVKLEIRKSRCAGRAHSPTSHKQCEVGY